jgi:hypothetical protein
MLFAAGGRSAAGAGENSASIMAQTNNGKLIILDNGNVGARMVRSV